MGVYLISIMVTQEVLAYVRARQQSGFSTGTIKDALVRAGWSAQDIEEIFAAVGGEKFAEQSEQNISVPVQSPIVKQVIEKVPTTFPTEPISTQTSASIPPAQIPPKPITPPDFSPKPTSNEIPVSIKTTSPRIPVTPTLRALTAIDSQFRSGIDEKVVRALLLGVGWDTPAIDETFLAVQWGESLLDGKPAMQTPPPDARAPKLGIVDSTLTQVPMVPTRHALIAIDALLHSGVSKGNIRTLLLGVGWDAHSIDEAFLAVEWREPTVAGIPPAGSIVSPTVSASPTQASGIITPPEQENTVIQAEESPTKPV
jgi:hypothetical protein